MTYDVIVIGAGIMGASSARSLAEKGAKVLVIDSLPLRNAVNASNDVSRIFRTYQLGDVLKTRMARTALEGWERLAELYPKRGIMRPSEVLVLDPDHHELVLPDGSVSWLGGAGLEFRFPEFRATSAVLDASGAILHASAALVATAKAAKAAGARFMHGRAVRDIRGGTVTLADGKRLDAGQVTVACGSWTDRLLGGRLAVRSTRQDVAFFRPRRLKFFACGRFPIFAHPPTWFYGFPDHGIGAVKVARHALGPEMDPDEPSGPAYPRFIEACRDFFSDVIPALSGAALVRSRTCRYAVREGEEFLIDRLDDRTVVATAFRGEGFKFAPVIGELVAELVRGDALPDDYARFRL